MKAVISPAVLSGSIRAIPSKSRAHRLLICSAFADRATKLACPGLSEDIGATANCLRALGAKIEYADGEFTVLPVERPVANALLDCGESGSTLRFLLPVVCALGGGALIKMHGRLPQRPLSPLWEELERCGARLSREGEDCIRVSGGLDKRDFAIPANVSSQFISGLLFALPLLGGGSVRPLGEVESAGYIEMSLRSMEDFSLRPLYENGCYRLEGGRYLSPGSVAVEGDWSNGAFWLVAEAIGGAGLRCGGLDETSPQGDRAVVDCIAAIRGGGAVIDASQIPDLVPVLAVLAALTPDRTRFVKAGRLRIKESDRLAAVSAMLRELGADIAETGEGLVIDGKSSLPGGITHSRGDHRIAMSAAVAAVGCRGEVVIENAAAVNKSYPDFWRDYASLGGRVKLEE